MPITLKILLLIQNYFKIGTCESTGYMTIQILKEKIKGPKKKEKDVCRSY